MSTSGTRKKEGIPPFPIITALRCPDLLLFFKCADLAILLHDYIDNI